MHSKTNIYESSKLLISSLFILFALFVKLVAILCVNPWDNNFSKEFTRFLGCVLSNLLMSALECGNFCLIVTTARSVYLSSLISSTVMMDLTHLSEIWTCHNLNPLKTNFISVLLFGRLNSVDLKLGNNIQLPSHELTPFPWFDLVNDLI